MSSFEVRLSGTGGQGLQLAARILAEALMSAGQEVAQSQSYEPTSRGGLSRADLVVASGRVDYPLVTALDYLVILDQCAARASDGLIKAGATVLVDQHRVPHPPAGSFRIVSLPFSETARSAGSERVANLVALGTLVRLSAIAGRAALEAAVEQLSPAQFRALNVEALHLGFRLAEAAGPDLGGTLE